MQWGGQDDARREDTQARRCERLVQKIFPKGAWSCMRKDYRLRKYFFLACQVLFEIAFNGPIKTLNLGRLVSRRCSRSSRMRECLRSWRPPLSEMPVKGGRMEPSRLPDSPCIDVIRDLVDQCSIDSQACLVDNICLRCVTHIARKRVIRSRSTTYFKHGSSFGSGRFPRA